MEQLKSKHFTVDGKGFTLHYLCVVGSKLHGVSNENSDTDLKGVFTYDRELLFGLNQLQETVEKSNVKKESWDLFVKELNQELQLELNSEDDVVLFESKKFAVTALKSELNMLDMLSSDMVLLESEEFSELRKNAESFLDFELARKRFVGFSHNALKVFERSKRPKDLAKTLHTLFLFKQLLKNKVYSPKMENQEEQKLVVDTRNGLVTEEFVRNKQVELLEELSLLNMPMSTQNFELVNNLVVRLNVR